MRWLGLAVRRTASIARKEFVHIVMDPGALFLVVLAPALLLTLLAYIFTFDVGDHNLVLVDMDQSPQATEYVRALTADGRLHIVAQARSYGEGLRYLERNRADAVIIIPPGFGASLSAGRVAPVHSVVDGVDASAARQVMAALDARTHRYMAELGLAVPPPIDVRVRVWFNENMSSQHSMIPGLMALVLILPAMAVALGVTREKETGTFESLVTTPLLGSDVLVGKVLVYLVMGLLSALVALAVAIFWFGVPFRGSLPLWLLATGAYLLACMAFSLIVAHFARAQQTAMMIILLVLFMPGFLLSGLSDPVNPDAFASWLFSQLLPTTHYITLSRAITLKAIPVAELWFPLVALLVMGAVGIGAAVALFEKKIG